MAKKKIAKKKAAAKKTKGVAATSKAAAKSAAKTKAPAKATAKTVKKATRAPAAKKSVAKTASNATKTTRAASGTAEAKLGEQLRYCLENDRLTEQDLFATVARLLHDNLGYSALNVFYNTDAAGKGGNFDLLAATGVDPTLLYYADAPAPRAPQSSQRFSIKFGARPTGNDLLDEGGGFRPFTLPRETEGDESEDRNSASPAGFPVALQSLPETKDAALSILYIPFGTPGEPEAVVGFVAAVLVNPRPRYTKSDFEPAALIASVLRRNLLRFRLNRERADNQAQLAELRATAAEKQARLEARVQALEEQTGEQHQIRKDLESDLEKERRAAQESRAELTASLAAATRLSEERQAALESRAAEFEQLKSRADSLEKDQAEKLAGQKRELDELLEMQERELRGELEQQKAAVASLRQELTSARGTGEETAQRARSEQQALKARAEAAEKTQRELTERFEKTAAELKSTRENLDQARKNHEQQIEKIQSEHAEALKTATSGSESQVQTIQSDYEGRLKVLRENAEARLKERESELQGEIERLKAAREDAGAEQELLGEELEKNAAQLKSARAESDELRERIARLEQKVEAADRERDALNERAAKLDEELAGARQSGIEADRINTSRAEENKRLQDQLAARNNEVQELQRTGQSVAKELEGLKNNLGSRDEALKLEQSRSAERQSRVETLEISLAEKTRDLNEQSASYDQLLKEEQEKQAAATAELQKARSTIEQKETDYHNALYELKQKVNTLTETLERTRAQARAGETEHQSEVAALKAATRHAEAEYKRQLSEHNNRAEDLERQLSEARDASGRLSGELKAEQDALRESHKTVESLRSEVSALQTRIAELGENHSREVSRLEEAAKSRESETSRELANRDNALQNARTTIETHEKRIETLDRDLVRLREEKSHLNQKLNEAGRVEKGLRQDLTAGAAVAANLNDTIAKAQLDIEELTQERDTAREEGARLRQDIGIRREREARLEQAIAGLKEEIHGLNNRLSEAGQKKRELDQNIASLRESLQSTRSELSEQYQKERKLGEELNAALAREKGSEEEGRLLASLTNAISNLPAFTDKIRYLRQNVPGRADIERVVIYRLIDDDTLLFQDGYHGDRRLDALRGRRVPLKDTTFGQAMVSLRPRRLETGKNLKNPDLPGGLETLLDENAAPDRELKSFLCLPLMESESGIGLMVLASTKAKAFDDKHVRVLGNIAPLFAVAVQFERNNAELLLHRARIHNFKQVTHYQERRYLKTANQLHRLSTRILPVLRDGLPQNAADSETERDAGRSGDPLSEDLLREINDYSQLALPGSLQNAVDFLQWIETLGARLSSDVNLNFEHELSMDSLGRLADRIGSGFQNLYWLVAEALENVARHSQATKLSIALTETDGHFKFSIVDNGEGLVRTAGTERPEHGGGLAAISNLAEAAGGHAAFARDANGHGLAVHVAWDPDENDLDATLRGARELPVA
jgi:chromosome segregation ATPase